MPCSSPNFAQFGTPKEKAEQIEADLGGEIVAEKKPSFPPTTSTRPPP